MRCGLPRGSRGVRVGGRKLRPSSSLGVRTIEVRVFPSHDSCTTRTPRTCPRPRSKKGAGSSQAPDRGCSQDVCDSLHPRGRSSIAQEGGASRRSLMSPHDRGSRVGGRKLRPSSSLGVRSIVVRVLFGREIGVARPLDALGGLDRARGSVRRRRAGVDLAHAVNSIKQTRTRWPLTAYVSAYTTTPHLSRSGAAW